LTMLGLVACGDDSGSSSSASTAPSASSAPSGSTGPETSGGGTASPATLVVTASEPAAGKYAFDVPTEIQGGTTEITLDNTGKEPHELGFVKVSAGTTAQQFADDVLTPQGASIPDYVVGAPGGLGAVTPGASGTSTISLDEGTYVYFCTFSNSAGVAHYTAGMLGEVTVKGTANTDPLPKTSAEVDASEYKFDVNGLKTGENTLTFANKGNQFHHLVAVPLTPGATLDDVKTFLQSSSNSSGPPPENAPIDFNNEQDLAVTGPGQAQVTTLTLDKGSYVFLCFLSDKTGGPPHFTKGMLQQVDIG
jgi:plastocyanin